MKSNIQKAIHRIQLKRNPPISQEDARQKAKDNFVKPHIETLILSRLNQGDSYGYEIAQFVKKTSGGQLHIPEGAMYPTLYRMIGKGYIADYQLTSGKNQLRVYYQITPAGRDRLKMLMEACDEACTGYHACLTAMQAGQA